MDSTSVECGKLKPEQMLWARCSEEQTPTPTTGIRGALRTMARINGVLAVNIINAGSGIGLLLSQFIAESDAELIAWTGPNISIF